MMTAGKKMKNAMEQSRIMPFVGVYDVLSATMAARNFDGIFLSGYGFSASSYGLPDIGMISWTDMVDFARRVRRVVPQAHILVDLDDGYGDDEIACQAVRDLESAGISGIVLEDQARPKRCGHMDGKRLLPLPIALRRLTRVLSARHSMVVIARTDASEPEEIERRVRAFSRTNADLILVDGIGELSLLKRVRNLTDKPLVLNQIAGGKSNSASLNELAGMGFSVVLFSTPCLFPAIRAVSAALDSLKESQSLPKTTEGEFLLADCNKILDENLKGRS